jgi:hypothetical protein
MEIVQKALILNGLTRFYSWGLTLSPRQIAFILGQ